MRSRKQTLIGRLFRIACTVLLVGGMAYVVQDADAQRGGGRGGGGRGGGKGSVRHSSKSGARS
ncbi:MAG: hypothetical protein ACYTG1_09455, partial [Planctomycetota bacterium]